MSGKAEELEPTLDRRLRWLADDLLRCSCDEAYTSRGLIAPDCNAHDGYAETISEARTRLTALRRGVERLQDDADRLDWLEKYGSTIADSAITDDVVLSFVDKQSYLHERVAGSLREAIDKARTLTEHTDPDAS